MWDLRYVLLALGAAAAALGCGDSGQTGSHTTVDCDWEMGACACGLMSGFGGSVVTATVSEVDEAAGTVVLDVDSVERSTTVQGGVVPPVTIDNAAPGWHLSGTYWQIDLARAADHGSCGSPPAPAVGERVRAGFGLSMAGFNCAGCVRDIDCDIFCPPRGTAATLHVYDGIRLLPLADSYDFAGIVLSATDVLAMDQQDCAALFPTRPAPTCDFDTVGQNEGKGCALGPASRGPGSCLAWCAAALVVGAIRRRRRQFTH